MNEELVRILKSLKEDFSYSDISDYQNLLLIIYNSLFLYEDELTSDIKYRIYETLSTIISNIEKLNHEQGNCCNNAKANKANDLAVLDYVLTPFYMQNGIRPRYRCFQEIIDMQLKGR